MYDSIEFKGLLYTSYTVRDSILKVSYGTPGFIFAKAA